MAEYIERKQALDRFTYEKGDMIPEALETGEENTVSIKSVKAVLRSLPASDVAPVVHGKWIDEDFPEKMATVHGLAICSVCGELSHKAEHGYNILSNYCPYCGAKMDGGEYEI